MKKLLGVIMVFLIVSASIKYTHEENVKKAHEEGYQIGYKEAYSEKTNEYESMFVEQENEFKKLLVTLEKEYSKKIEKAEQDGLYKGKQDQLQLVNEKLNKNAEEAQKENRWDQILYEVR